MTSPTDPSATFQSRLVDDGEGGIRVTAEPHERRSETSTADAEPAETRQDRIARLRREAGLPPHPPAKTGSLT